MRRLRTPGASLLALLAVGVLFACDESSVAPADDPAAPGVVAQHAAPASPGPPFGVSFRVRLTTLVNVSPGAVEVAQILCDDGEFATGGGFEMFQQGTPDWFIRGSFPVLDPPVGWQVEASNQSSTLRQFRAYVVCAEVSSPGSSG